MQTPGVGTVTGIQLLKQRDRWTDRQTEGHWERQDVCICGVRVSKLQVISVENTLEQKGENIAFRFQPSALVTMGDRSTCWRGRPVAQSKSLRMGSSRQEAQTPLPAGHRKRTCCSPRSDTTNNFWGRERKSKRQKTKMCDEKKKNNYY